MNHYTNTRGHKKGFTLFVAVLASSLILALGFSIGNIILKQLTITSGAGGSLAAFYAADSAMECAIFWDRKDAAGDTVITSPFGTTTVTDFDTTVTCGPYGNAGIYSLIKSCDTGSCTEFSTNATTTFTLDLSDPQDPQYKACSMVQVAKQFDLGTGEESTNISVRGYNSGVFASGADYQCDLTKSRVVERGLEQAY